MFVLMIYSRIMEERKILQEVSRDIVAHLSEEKMQLVFAAMPEEAKERLEEEQLLEFAFMSVSDEEDIRLLRETRSKFAQAELMLLADEKICPMNYLTPDIRAASLLLRPYSYEQCRKTVKEFFCTVLERREQKDERTFLIVQNRNGKIAVPFQKIYYIEARERKIFIRLRGIEYCEYETLEHVMTLLPKEFLQCHRSFVFNTVYLENVRLSEGMVYLEHGIMVPVSRSYKKAVKEFLNEQRRI